MNCIEKYFKDLTVRQIAQFDQFKDIYTFWNSRINLISRKDIENLCIHHILHSLSIAKIIQFIPGTKIMDAGTGGGFPGIPLAVLFPEATFILVDSIVKKIKVVESVIRALKLDNCVAVCQRIEKAIDQVDFVVSRAATSLPRLVHWTAPVISEKNSNSLNNGIICLKGGKLEEELINITYNYFIYQINRYFDEDFFKTKKIVYINLINKN